jgi:DtxR family Mn-dependent transcriptional regulator
MVNPGFALLVAFFLTGITALILWPDKGLWAKRKKAKYSDKKALMEDALKYIYDRESRNTVCDIKSLSKSLKNSYQETENIVTRLKSLGLLMEGINFKLSPEGKDYALRVLRIHRLWERYLAEETGVPESDWHRNAEIQEHKMTIEEANELSKYLGYPRYDPHGDPIPTQSGDLPPKRGRALVDFSQGDTVRVIHIEDEPPELYDEIVSKGIYLENHIEILKKSDNNLHILTNGNSQTISIRVANNITVVQSWDDSEVDDSLQTLNSIDPGELAEVVHISKACRGTQRRRLMDLGIVPGTNISIEMVSAGGDPTAYRIRGAVIALRNDQARHVYIRILKEVKQDGN